uniref:Uncharacterized protein n=1 Tax=Anguilla anguilla TaxID=7936 RepID=A0A0E9QIX6_ANGAN
MPSRSTILTFTHISISKKGAKLTTISLLTYCCTFLIGEQNMCLLEHC